jgi:hypothetical protein
MSGEADPNAQLLTLHLHPAEQGESFSLDPQTYRRLAFACLSVHSDLMTIRKLNNAEPGCIVDLYSSDSLLKAVSLDLFATLDSPESSCLLSVEDSKEGWRRIRQMMGTVLEAKE